MASAINKKNLENAAELSRLELQEKEADRLLEDLKKILEHFNELQELDTENVQAEHPFGGEDVFRKDEDRMGTNLGLGKDAFPENENGYLVIPPVF